MDINILQGERSMARDNISLGKFTLTGILPALRGLPQIEVSFDIDANGILHVNAKDKKTGKEQSMQVVAPNKMARDEIDKKVHDAEEYASQDKDILEKVQTKNDAEALIYTTEKMLKDNSDKVPKDIAEKVTKSKDELSEAAQKGRHLRDQAEVRRTKERPSGDRFKRIRPGPAGSRTFRFRSTPGPEGPENPDVSADANSEGQ